jgi:LDH2 family malate/lactate/ureidoglycolate dehydrogenase
LAVEILCGVLAGAAMSKEVGSIFKYEQPIGAGHFFLVIDIAQFQPMEHFLARIDLLLSWMKGSAGEGHEVRFPGEIRGELAARYERDGIPLPDESVQPLTKLARELHVQTPW